MDKDKLTYFIFGLSVALYAISPQVLSPLLLWGLVAYGLYSILKYFSEQDQRKRKSQGTKRRDIPKSKPKTKAQKPSHSPSHDKLTTEIRILTHSQEVADRLLESYREKYPGQSEQWRKEKIIYDLKRDRGCP